MILYEMKLKINNSNKLLTHDYVSSDNPGEIPSRAAWDGVVELHTCPQHPWDVIQTCYSYQNLPMFDHWQRLLPGGWLPYISVHVMAVLLNCL
jgi:hypothetical protein